MGSKKINAILVLINMRCEAEFVSDKHQRASCNHTPNNPLHTSQKATSEKCKFDSD